jgi:type I restriction enzyme, S subunit
MKCEPLGQHATLIRGITFSPSDKCEPGTPDSVVCLRTSNIQEQLDQSDLLAVPFSLVKSPEKHIRVGDVLVSSANSWNLVGKCCRVTSLRFASTAGGFISILRPTTDCLDSSYLYRWFSWDRTQETVRSFGRQTTNISNLDHKRTLLLPIPLPTLHKQKRIVAILDAAEALRAKRRESISQLDSLVQAMFSDMFGNPVVNPKGWEECPFADVIDRLEGGKNVAPSESPSDHRILKVSAVTYGEYRPEEAKWLPADFIPPDSYIVRSGDLLISRANTVNLIGATAYVWDTPAQMVLPDKIWRFVWKDGAPVDSLYVFHMTRHKDFQRLIGSRASGTSGSMKNISKPKLLGLTIPLPPLPLQQEFAKRVRRIRAQRAIVVKQLSELESLFSSLQSQAFNGGLSASVLSEPLSA